MASQKFTELLAALRNETYPFRFQDSGLSLDRVLHLRIGEGGLYRENQLLGLVLPRSG